MEKVYIARKVQDGEILDNYIFKNEDDAADSSIAFIVQNADMSVCSSHDKKTMKLTIDALYRVTGRTAEFENLSIDRDTAINMLKQGWSFNFKDRDSKNCTVQVIEATLVTED